MSAITYHLKLMPAEARQVLEGHKAYRFCPVTQTFHVWFGGKSIEVYSAQGTPVDTYGNGEWYDGRQVTRTMARRAMDARLARNRRMYPGCDDGCRDCGSEHC